MERKNCPLCKNEKVRRGGVISYPGLYEGMGKKGYEQKILACDECNMVWIENPVEQAVLDRHYKEMSKYEPETEIGKQDVSSQKMFRRQNTFLNSRIDDYESVLEVGAATGESLSLYKEQGKHVVGIEPSGRNKKYAKKQYDIEMYDMTFNEYCEEIGIETKYDLVFLSHVLEHIVDFSEFMENIVKISNKYIFIEIPFLENRGSGNEPFGIFTDEHVNYFTVSSLSRLMEDNGCFLTAANVELNVGGEMPGYPTLVTLWQKGSGNGKKAGMHYDFLAGNLLQEYFSKCEAEFEKIRQIINTITEENKLAIWGTGTHTSRLLGMTDLGDKNIVKFYDSDRKKQGLIMLGKKIEPFRKEDVEAGIVDTILISSYASERAIEKIILSQNIEAPLRIICLY